MLMYFNSPLIFTRRFLTNVATVDPSRCRLYVFRVETTHLQKIRFANWHLNHIFMQIWYDCCDRVLLSVDCLGESWESVSHFRRFECSTQSAVLQLQPLETSSAWILMAECDSRLLLTSSHWPLFDFFFFFPPSCVECVPCLHLAEFSRFLSNTCSGSDWCFLRGPCSLPLSCSGCWTTTRRPRG